jgi:hypothetical protein
MASVSSPDTRLSGLEGLEMARAAFAAAVAEKS